MRIKVRTLCILGFLLIIIPSQQSVNERLTGNYLVLLQDNAEFRNYVINNNNCVNSSVFIDKYLSEEIGYTLCVNKKSNNLPIKEIYVDTMFIVGNYSDINYKTVRLYYWAK